jgi:hypothetical protein
MSLGADVGIGSRVGCYIGMGIDIAFGVGRSLSKQRKRDTRQRGCIAVEGKVFDMPGIAAMRDQADRCCFEGNVVVETCRPTV